MKKSIELTPLAEIGRGSAQISDNSVLIEISGINGAMKAWLIGGEATPIGNVVGGVIRKEIDTTAHSGILITQSGRQMLIGRYKDEAEQKPVSPRVPFDSHGFSWEKVTGRKFENLSDELRFLLSNKAVYRSYKKYGHYWVGQSKRGSALAVACGENDINPFASGILKNGYAIVCVDKETKKLYIP